MWTEADDERVKEFCKTADVGKLTKCPKCGMGDGGSSEMMLAHFCTHKYCPFRDYRLSKEPKVEKDTRPRVTDVATPLHNAVVSYLDFLRRSVNVGPLTNNPTKEAALLRRLMELTAPQAHIEKPDGGQS